MKYKIDLTTGNIALKLTKVSLPIMFTSFIQMAYQLTDMFWVGRLGSGAVAAIGSAGFFGWLGMSIAFMAKIGTEVCIAQAAGRNDQESVKNYMINGLGLAVLLTSIYASLIFIFAPSLINFFNLGTDVNSYNPTSNAISYLRIISFGMVLTFTHPTFSAIYNGLGKTKLPFYIMSTGLLCNMVLDPLLIFGIGPFPKMGVQGAAIATVIAQILVTTQFVLSIKKNFDFIKGVKCFFNISKEYYLKIMKIGFPPSIQSALFAIIAILIARIISQWGPIPIAVQRIGSQIEALAWMTAGGFSTALSAFVGQNYGAGLNKRVWEGYLTAFSIMSGIGIFVSLLLYIFPEFLFSIFVKEADTIHQGIVYLKILAYSQLFMCIEIMTQGAFNGLGKSMPPSIVGITFNILRIPTAIILSGIIGLNGIWWSISGSSIFKGVILVIWFVLFYQKKVAKYKNN
ncbi:MAG: MATE family efflux transporter [Candidatus Cloacimonetes bacterium]|nr:MATE family efflux transporter [Candidatus Cloacimonadota bacterium]